METKLNIKSFTTLFDQLTFDDQDKLLIHLFKKQSSKRQISTLLSLIESQTFDDKQAFLINLGSNLYGYTYDDKVCEIIYAKNEREATLKMLKEGNIIGNDDHIIEIVEIIYTVVTTPGLMNDCKTSISNNTPISINGKNIDLEHLSINISLYNKNKDLYDELINYIDEHKLSIKDIFNNDETLLIINKIVNFTQADQPNIDFRLPSNLTKLCITRMMILIEASYIFVGEYNISKLYDILTTLQTNRTIKLELMKYSTNAHHLMNIIKENKITLSSNEASAVYNIMKKT
jgi:hypothetical protein